MNRKLLLILFGLVVIVQLGVLIKMIWDSENVINSGTAFQFELQPIDPNDPFRGKFMTLNFEQSEFKTDTCHLINREQDAFVVIQNGQDGYAKIKSIDFEQPLPNEYYIKSKVYCNGFYGTATSNNTNSKITHYTYRIEYPFERYFMNEKTIKTAEEKVRVALRDSTARVYGEVRIKADQSRLTSVLIDGVPIEL